MNQPLGKFEEIQHVSFIGLGVMGYPMAGHLARNGFEVQVYNRTTKRAEEWVAEYGGTMAASPAEAAEGAQVVCACVGNDDDVRQIATSKDCVFSGLQKNATFIDHTTASAIVAR